MEAILDLERLHERYHEVNTRNGEGCALSERMETANRFTFKVVPGMGLHPCIE